MNKVIITGADGFIGSNTAKCFIQHGVEVLALDMIETPKRLESNKLLTYLKADVTDTDYLYSCIKKDYYDTFIHFAWAGSAGHDRINYQLQMQNALNTVECMKMAKKLGCTRFICAGSIMEKEVEAVVHTQGSKPELSYIYGMGKHIAHCICKAVAADIGIELVWPMITNAFGAGELSPRFINNTLRRIINNDPLQFTAATQNYDFVYITDVAEAFYLISMNGKPFCEYIIGSSNARPLKEFILEMMNAVDCDVVPLFGDIPYTGINLPISTFDTGNTEEDCGFKAEVSFSEGTRKTMEWLKNQ